MANRDDKLPSRLQEFERSSHRPTDIENAYLRGQLSILKADKRQLEIRLAVLLTNRSQPRNRGPSLHRDATIQPPGAEVYQSDIELAILLAERSLLIRGTHRCRSVLAPYSKLPPDLVREIILLCLPEKFHSLPLWVGTNDVRLRITQVCAAWRRVAFSMPELWQVHLSNSDHTYKSSVNLANDWFSQSTASNIGLKILGGWQQSIFPKVDPVLFFDTIYSRLVVPYSSRFKSLGPLILNRLQWEALFDLPFDQLIMLSLNFQYLVENGEPRKLLSTPSLREIWVSHMPSTNALSAFPFKQLTSMTLSGSLTTENLPKVLAQCPSLQSCELREIRQLGSTFSTHDEAIELPHLTSLSISFVSAKSLGWLSVFRTPKLSSLVLSALPNTTQSLEGFVSFISSISQTLRRFEVRNVSEDSLYSLDSGAVEATFRAMPWVEHVFLPEAYAISLPTLEKIGTGELLPDVEHIEFTGMGPVSRTVDFLIPPQPSRSSNLRTVRIYSLMFGLGVDPPRVRELRAQGLDIRLETLW